MPSGRSYVFVNEGDSLEFEYADDEERQPFNMSRDTIGVKTNRNRKTFNLALWIRLLNPTLIAFVSASAALLITISVASSNKTLSSDNSTSTTTFGSSKSSSTSLSTTDGKINFSLYRIGYEPLAYFSNEVKDYAQYELLKKYNSIIEPHVSMHLQVEDDDDSEINRFEYSICSIEDESDCISGTKDEGNENKAVMVACTPGAEYTITVAEYNSVGKKVASDKGSAICLYVRREIRSLLDNDLADTMDAMYTLWQVKEEEGQITYGSDYHDSLFLLKMHHFNAAWQEADHIHEGNGFLMQHMKMTNIFEKSMQAVNPALSLPYWDFTIDHSEAKSAYDSYIMTADVFGSMKQPQDLSWGFTYGNDLIESASIQDGRWAGAKSEINIHYEALLAGYGYMRAPWNMNPSPYISRFTNDLEIGTFLPTCSQHYDMLDYDDMMDFFSDIENGAHATTHSLIGGVYGCDLLKPLLEMGAINDENGLKNICSKWVFYMKEFYRYNYLSPSDSCSVSSNVQESSCSYECNAQSSEEMIENFQKKVSAYIPEDFSEEKKSAWRSFICEGDGSKILAGDQLESASPSDPSFWVIHPTLERLLHAKLLAGGFTEESWEDDQRSDYVCSKAECYEESKGGKDFWEDCCYGHYASDKLLDSTTGDKSSHYGISNEEALAKSDPRSTDYSSTYVYDSFEWEHCTSTDFSAKLSALYSASERRRV